MQQVRAADIVARASRDPQTLIGAAEAQLAAGSTGTRWSWPSWPRPVTSAGATSGRGGDAPAGPGRLGRAKGSAAALAPSPLTSRETEVTQLAGRGLSDREIADELVLSIRTVQSHLASAYRKLGIASRSELKA